MSERLWLTYRHVGGINANLEFWLRLLLRLLGYRCIGHAVTGTVLEGNKYTMHFAKGR